MSELDDGALSNETGEGLAIALNNISVKMDKTSYVELTGVNISSDVQRALRMDLRWYGMSYTSSTGVTEWTGTCASGILNLGCPIGGTIANLAAHDNPLILRSSVNTNFDMAGGAATSHSVFEVLFPSRVGNGSLAANDVNQYTGAHTPYRFAFWGELNVGSGNAGGGGTALTRSAPAAAVSGLGDGSRRLQMLNIWNKVDQSGSAYRFFQTVGAGTPTLGLQVINNFSGDIRMSVAQNSASAYGVAPDFTDSEGLYMVDFRLHMPMGQLNYQALTFDSVPQGGSGSPSLQLVLNDIPSTQAVYDVFYGRSAANDSSGANADGYTRSAWSGNATNLGNYNLSHGFLRMGDYAPTQRTKDTNGYNAGNGNAWDATPCGGFGCGLQPAPANSLACVTATCRTNQVTRLLNSEVPACAPDRPGCTLASANNANNSTSDGLFFVAQSNFTVMRTSPNYTWAGANTASRTNDPMADANNPANGTIANSGIYTRDTIAAGTAINLGDVNISGMMIHNMTLKAY